jgi:NADP-dependent 3-hydroxy acid dehydrogenase YdfG
MNLQGKTAIITGASSGIGEGLARNLADAGMNLVLTARRAEKLEALAAELPVEAVCIAADIAEPQTPARLVDTAVERFGGCDVTVNNAGVMIVGPINEIDLDAACHMVRVNVEAAYRLAYLALRRMLEQQSGHLINISSTLGLKTRANVGAYSGTKYAIEALSEDLRIQVAGTGVKVTAFEPGLVQTHLQDHFPVHPADSLGIANMATPADIARAVRFVLEQPDHINIPRILVQPAEQAM